MHLCQVPINLQQFRKDAIQRLKPLYDENEATAIVDVLIEHLYLIKPHQLLYLHKELSAQESDHLEKMLIKLINGMPIQYILGEAHFGPYRFVVNEHVLIPRPETYELVEWIVNDYRHTKQLHFLDIGTGSGCIAVSLAKELASSLFWALDVSEQALAVAKQNANRYGVSINWLKGDFTNVDFRESLESFDVLVSNPPYIKQNESSTLHENVLKYEPHLALFVPNDDAMLFYKFIAQFGRSNLRPNGRVYVEINQELADQTVAIFNEAGYQDIELRKDLNGNWRMIKASAPSSN
jgi:release factor glutamine methyltransferase